MTPDILTEYSTSSMCHMSRVKCQMSHVTFISVFVFLDQVVERWRVCYQQGLPRLV